MGTPGKERQKKYIERQRQKGKLTVTLLLSKATKEILDREQKKTNETFSDIMEKALFCYEESLKPKAVPPPPPLPSPKPLAVKPGGKKTKKLATGDKSAAKPKRKKRLDNQVTFEF
ncbi:MAG: hypothetical protein NT072_11815 [Deltaproteobacteria bacterium]|nr:hypothetical protein [Deltaproteobacteria bacterium]